MQHDPSQTSHYIDDEFSRDLVDMFGEWQLEKNEILERPRRDELCQVLEREARLLDDARHTDWLALYAAECLYWVPASAGGGDPRREVAIAFDDRRRLEDRVYRLGSEYVWSQQPPSRTSRMVTNVAVFKTGRKNTVMTRSNFLITEFHAGDYRTWAGWYGHRLHRKEGRWEIMVKQVNLINYDQNLRNPSITL
ncbi:MAG: aromatic-ring-hydroxylating dioxygenase subunit beta [Pseudomonadota bacterium]|nr:aromatic-ring-hydroxylating dioxygenase subunit beta [Pseudomonadota bacterium]